MHLFILYVFLVVSHKLCKFIYRFYDKINYAKILFEKLGDIIQTNHLHVFLNCVDKLVYYFIWFQII